MAKGNFPLLSFNRGAVSPLAMARVDVDRIRLSAETMRNWIPKTQGAMRIRPGLKYIGSSLRDTGATWIPFIATTSDTGILLEITGDSGAAGGGMRIWIDDALLAYNKDTGRDTTVAGFVGGDTGEWTHHDTGGTASSAQGDLIPAMTGETTSGVTITASSNFNSVWAPWKAADDTITTGWESGSAVPQWLKIDFGVGNTKTAATYNIRAINLPASIGETPRSWRLLGSSGGDATDTGLWTFLDSGGDQTGWAVSERRTFTIGAPAAFRYYGLFVNQVNGGSLVTVAELELLPADGTAQSYFSGGALVLNGQTRGGIARVRQQITADTGNQNLEHGLAIGVTRGPVQLRIGSTAGNDDYVADTVLRTGKHRFAITPTSNIHVTLYSDDPVDRIVGSFAFADTGTVEIPTTWDSADLGKLRWTQSADVVFVAADGYKQQRIERRGTGRSWSVVDYQSDNGPFKSGRTVDGVRLKVAATFGNTTLTASQSFFTPDHVGALFYLFTNNYSWSFPLGHDGAFTDPIRIAGVTSSTAGDVDDRRFSYTVSGTWTGTLTAMSSTEDEDDGPYAATVRGAAAGDTGTTIEANATFTLNSRTDNALKNNLIEFFKVGFKPGGYSTGAATVVYDYNGGGAVGIVRVTGYTSETEVSVEVLKSPSTTQYTDNWREGQWSDEQGFPTEVSLFEGRLWWHGRSTTWGSVSDDFENFDDTTEGDAAPINRTLGEGPVDTIVFSLGLHRLLLGTASGVLAFRSTSFDEPLTAENMSVKQTSSQGAASLRAVRAENRAIYVHRATNRLYEMYYDIETNDYVARELTILNPDILSEGVVDIAIQRQPDTRIHCVLGDGKVAILTYEPNEELVCWSTVETTGDVEKVVVLPGTDEDKVYYHVNRTINGATKRYLERWAMESQTLGGKVCRLADSFKVTAGDTGTQLTGLTHLEGATVVLWRNGQDRGTFTVASGTITDTGMPTGGDTGVVGLAYTADYKSTKLAYAAQGGTALLQPKRVNEIGLILADTHHKGIKYGGDTGNLNDLPDMIDKGAKSDTGSILSTFDQMAFPFNGEWSTDSRIHLRAAAPRPATVAAAVISIETNER